MTWLDVLVLVVLGLFGGSVATVAGLGGGLLIVGMALWFGPHAALAVTAPALVLGHLHRVWMLRRSLDRSVLLPFVAGVAPVAFVGSLIVAQLDAQVLRWVLVGVLLLAVLDVIGWLELPQSKAPTRARGRGWLVLGGAGVGSMMVTGGGAGVLAAPVLRGAGQRGDAMVVTLAGAAVAGHLARTLAYGHSAMLDANGLLGASVLAGALIGGNLLGRRVAPRLDDETRERVLRVAVLLGLVGAMAEAVWN